MLQAKAEATEKQRLHSEKERTACWQAETKRRVMEQRRMLVLVERKKAETLQRNAATPAPESLLLQVLHALSPNNLNPRQGIL